VPYQQLVTFLLFLLPEWKGRLHGADEIIAQLRVKIET
jgi:hypothetical protein